MYFYLYFYILVFHHWSENSLTVGLFVFHPLSSEPIKTSPHQIVGGGRDELVMWLGGWRGLKWVVVTTCHQVHLSEL